MRHTYVDGKDAVGKILLNAIHPIADEIGGGGITAALGFNAFAQFTQRQDAEIECILMGGGQEIDNAGMGPEFAGFRYDIGVEQVAGHRLKDPPTGQYRGRARW